MGGAQALGMQNHLGRFAPGHVFDALLIDADVADGPFDPVDVLIPPTPGVSESASDKQVTAADLFERWTCVGDDRNTIGVWVQGRRVLGGSLADEKHRN